MIKKILFWFRSFWSTSLTLHASYAVFRKEKSPVLAAQIYKSGSFLRVYKSILLFYSVVLVKCMSNNYDYMTFYSLPNCSHIRGWLSLAPVVLSFQQLQYCPLFCITLLYILKLRILFKDLVPIFFFALKHSCNVWKNYYLVDSVAKRKNKCPKIILMIFSGNKVLHLKNFGFKFFVSFSMITVGFAAVNRSLITGKVM